jgi:hypothetical protein
MSYGEETDNGGKTANIVKIEEEIVLMTSSHYSKLQTKGWNVLNIHGTRAMPNDTIRHSINYYSNNPNKPDSFIYKNGGIVKKI